MWLPMCSHAATVPILRHSCTSCKQGVSCFRSSCLSRIDGIDNRAGDETGHESAADVLVTKASPRLECCICINDNVIQIYKIFDK